MKLYLLQLHQDNSCAGCHAPNAGFGDSPLDEYAMGNTNALAQSQKRSAVIFFGKGKCVTCHATKDESNQMLNDFKMHNAGVP